MSIELRSIRCHHFRITSEPCMNPAVVEILGPSHRLLCVEHAALELEPEPGLAHLEGWEEHGAGEYARHCEDALDALTGLDRDNGADEPSPRNPVLEDILEEAITYLEQYELERARRVLERQGGDRKQTIREQRRQKLLEGLA